jgi:hypothetical protein
MPTPVFPGAGTLPAAKPLPDTMPGLTTMANPLPSPSNIDSPYEVDGYLVQLEPNLAYSIRVTGASQGQTLPDPFVTVGDLISGETFFAADDAPDGTLDPAAAFTVPLSRSYLVAVGDATGGTGTYGLFLTDPQGQNAQGFFAFDYQVNPPGGRPLSNPPPLATPVFGVLGVQEAADTDLSPVG